MVILSLRTSDASDRVTDMVSELSLGRISKFVTKQALPTFSLQPPEDGEPSGSNDSATGMKHIPWKNCGKRANKTVPPASAKRGGVCFRSFQKHGKDLMERRRA